MVKKVKCQIKVKFLNINITIPFIIQLLKFPCDLYIKYTVEIKAENKGYYSLTLN